MVRSSTISKVLTLIFLASVVVPAVRADTFTLNAQLWFPPDITVGSFDLEIGFDPDLLSLNGVTFGQSPGDTSASEANTNRYTVGPPNPYNGEGEAVVFSEVSLLSNSELTQLQNGASTLLLASFSFTKIGMGNAYFDCGFLNGRSALLDGNGNPIGPQTNTETCTVRSFSLRLTEGDDNFSVDPSRLPGGVPEPATVALVASGIALTVPLRRRRYEAGLTHKA